jgi:hypothetical protein
MEGPGNIQEWDAKIYESLEFIVVFPWFSWGM